MNKNGPKRILVYQTGSIGDTLVSLPVLNWIRSQYPSARLDLLCSSGNTGFSGPNELLGECGLFNQIISYIPGRGFRQLSNAFHLFRRLRGQYDLAFYLIRSVPYWKQRSRRDLLFLNLLGIQHIRGIGNEFEFPVKRRGEKLPTLPTHTQILFQRLQHEGFPVPEKTEEYDLNMHFSQDEIAFAKKWMAQKMSGKEGVPFAVGIGGKRQVCRWPRERYVEVLSRITEEFELIPFFFGDSNDTQDIQKMQESLPVGVNASGELSLRQTVAIMHHCRFYLGNDTGSMHLAAVAGIPCVAIFSAHNYRGLWYPFGDKNNQILRADCECENCRLQTCLHSPPSCLQMIGTEEVYQAVCQIRSQAE
jgi:ADP-heptose:LPS heptosyltransferase